MDSRLTVAGKEPMLRKEDRFKEFRSWHRQDSRAAIEIGVRRVVADEFLYPLGIDRDGVGHLARDGPCRGCRGGEVPETENKVMLMPGFPCPLCRFPTYSWVEDMGNKIETYGTRFHPRESPWLEISNSGPATAASRSTSCALTVSCTRGTTVATDSTIQIVATSCGFCRRPLPKRHRNLPNTKRLCRNNRLHHRCGRIGCVLPVPLTRHCFWSDAQSAAIAPRSVRTGSITSHPQNGTPVILRIRCRAISARMYPALRPVPPRRCSLSKDERIYEWVSRLCRTESARQDGGAMPAHLSVPRMPYRWILARSVLL